MYKIVQINLNNQGGSNDLLLQFMRERRIALAAISEPNVIPDDPGWTTSLNGRAAITWRGAVNNLECSVVVRCMGFCMISWAGLYVCSCYFLPNRGSDEFRDWLNQINVFLSLYVDLPVMVLGDFNAISLAWDTANNDYRCTI